MRAIWNHQVIAQSGDIVVVEGNSFFPMDSLRRQFVLLSDTNTVCPWKGQASYFTLQVNGQINPDAAWFYPHPKAGAEAVKDRVAFWKGVQVLQ